jgi:hypothetical protein
MLVDGGEQLRFVMLAVFSPTGDRVILTDDPTMLNTTSAARCSIRTTPTPPSPPRSERLLELTENGLFSAAAASLSSSGTPLL